MALGDTVADPGDELTVTTLAGDVFVFGLQNNQFSSAPLYRSWVAGGLGLYNSIVIQELDQAAPGPEQYIASSLGIRKWRRP